MNKKELAAEVERLRAEVSMLRMELAARPIFVPAPQQPYYPQWWHPTQPYPVITCGTTTEGAPSTVTLRSA